MRGEERLVGRKVLVLTRRKKRLWVIERGGVLRLDMERVRIDLKTNLIHRLGRKVCEGVPSLSSPSESSGPET